MAWRDSYGFDLVRKSSFLVLETIRGHMDAGGQRIKTTNTDTHCRHAEQTVTLYLNRTLTDPLPHTFTPVSHNEFLATWDVSFSSFCFK